MNIKHSGVHTHIHTHKLTSWYSCILTVSRRIRCRFRDSCLTCTSHMITMGGSCDTISFHLEPYLLGEGGGSHFNVLGGIIYDCLERASQMVLIKCLTSVRVWRCEGVMQVEGHYKLTPVPATIEERATVTWTLTLANVYRKYKHSR